MFFRTACLVGKAHYSEGLKKWFKRNSRPLYEIFTKKIKNKEALKKSAQELKIK